jgi:hypothetical protein
LEVAELAPPDSERRKVEALVVLDDISKQDMRTIVKLKKNMFKEKATAG